MRQLTSSAALWRKSRWTFSVSRNPSDIWTRFSLYCSLTPCTPCYWNISDLQINLILNTLDIAECVLSRFLGIWRVLHVRLISDSWLMVIGDRYLDHCYSPTFMFLRIPPPPQIVSEEIRPDQSMHTLHLESVFTHILRVPYQCFLFWSVIRYLLCFGCIVMEALFFVFWNMLTIANELLHSYYSVSPCCAWCCHLCTTSNYMALKMDPTSSP